MATITSKLLSLARKEMANGVAPNWTKQELNGSMQAVVNLILTASSRTAINNVIETAAPGVFSASEKKYILAASANIIAIKEKK